VKRFEVKFKGRLGPGRNDNKFVRVLNRIITWTGEGIQYEADQRHSEIIIRQLGLQEASNSVVTPGFRINGEGEEKKLSAEEASRGQSELSMPGQVGHSICGERIVQVNVRSDNRQLDEP
jgi:hypothetical protein